MLPPLARSSPASTAISELFPDPDGPSSATDVPAATSRSTPRKISTGALSLPSVSVTLWAAIARLGEGRRSEEHTSELQSLMRISYAVFCLKKTRETYKITMDLSTHILNTHTTIESRKLNTHNEQQT